MLLLIARKSRRPHNIFYGIGPKASWKSIEPIRIRSIKLCFNHTSREKKAFQAENHKKKKIYKSKNTQAI